MSAKQVPEWLETLIREARIRPGLVLYGNTRDLFWSGSGAEYCSLPALLVRKLEGFDVRAIWDRADGLRFANADDGRRWQEAVQRSVGAGPPKGKAYDMGGEERPAPSPQEATSSGLDGKGERIELDELLSRYRAVVGQPGGPRPLLVVDWSHLLVAQPAHPDQGERDWILRLGKAIRGSPIQRIDSDRLGTTPGLLVLVSASLGAIPPVIYQGEPRVRLVSIPPPSAVERKTFFERHGDDLRVAAPRSPSGGPQRPARTERAEELADLTEQLSLADLRQLVALSRGGAPSEPRSLVNLYLLGEQRSPWEEISDDKLAKVRETLRARVAGQEGPIERVATMIVRASLGLAGLEHSARRTKPKGTLFFVGPTGVGKTELAKACAEFLFGDESACLRFDMSEYNHEHSDQRLVGAPPGYVGFEDGGQLTNAVRARPFSVLLFDEIEKAHARVLDKFLQILEDGRLTDGRGETSWFSEAVIIFTSNIGAADTPPPEGGAGEWEQHFLRMVEEHFVKKLGRPELLNRLGDNVVVFRPVQDPTIRRRILDSKVRPAVDHLLARWGVELVLPDAVRDHLVARARLDHGGRGLVNVLERELINPLAQFLFEHKAKLRKGRRIEVTLDASKSLELELTDA